MNSLRTLATLALLGLAALAARAQNVGIGTTAPTQQLDVNGNLRLRGLSGTGARLPQVQADGTLGLLSTPAGAGSAAASPVLLNPNPPLGTTGGTRLAQNIEDGSGYAVQNMHNTVAVAGGILYVAGDNLVQSFDVSNPVQPTMLDKITIPSGQAVVVSGSRAYVGGFRTRANNSDRYLRILDISQPAALALRDSLEVGGSIYALAISGTSVYVAVANNGNVQLKRYETSTGALVPSGAVGLPSTGAAFSLVVQGSLACLATVANPRATSGQLLVVDTSDPQSLTLRGAVAIPSVPHGLALNGAIAYVLTTDGNLRPFDTSPTVPQPLTTIPVGTQPSDIVLSGTTAYVTNYGSSTLQVFDVSQPANPVFRGQATTSANPFGVASDGQVAYVISPYTLQAFQVNSVRPIGLLADGTLGVGTAPTLSVNGQQLGLSGGNTVTLPGDNLGNHTATQQLALAAAGLKFSDGTTLTTAPVGDNLGNHTATRNLNLAGYQLVGQGGTTGLTITSAGNTGLGTTTPSQLLELGGQAAPALLLHSNSNNQVSGGTLQWRENDPNYGWNLRHNTGGSEEGSTTDRLVLERVNGSATSPAMSWDQNTGQVGIGTSAPAAALDVRGSVSVSEVLTISALRSPTTGSHNLAPVAYGTFSGDGQLLNSSGNVTVQGSNGDYTLVINGSNTGNYVIMAFPFNSPFVGFGLCAEYRPYYINANGPFTNRIVTYKQGDSGLSAHGFNFVVFQP